VVGGTLHPSECRENRRISMEKYMGKEITLWEFRLETSIEKKIDEFGILSDKIDKVKSELEEMMNRYKVMEGEIRPVLEQGFKGVDIGKINLHKKGNIGDVLNPPSDI